VQNHHVYNSKIKRYVAGVTKRACLLVIYKVGRRKETPKSIQSCASIKWPHAPDKIKGIYISLNAIGEARETREYIS
jgi:hypothetical protein